MESIIETNAATILQFVHGLRGNVHVTLEEGTCNGVIVMWESRKSQRTKTLLSGLGLSPDYAVLCATVGRMPAAFEIRRETVDTLHGCRVKAGPETMIGPLMNSIDGPGQRILATL